jgi:acyl carrier protein
VNSRRESGYSQPFISATPDRSVLVNRLATTNSPVPAVVEVSTWKERVQSTARLTPLSIPSSTQTTHLPSDNGPTTQPRFSEPTLPPARDMQASSPLIPAKSATRDALQKFLVDFVIEQTGYPEDVVSVDADLEADLGIDSIKIAQMMGEVIEHFGFDPKGLRRTSADNYKSLAAIIESLTSFDTASPLTSSTFMPPEVQAVLTPTAEKTETDEEQPVLSDLQKPVVTRSHDARLDQDQLREFLVAFIVEQTGYPEDIVTLEADLEADLGIDSIKIAQMMGEMNEHFGLTLKDYNGRTMDDFKNLGAIIAHLT